VGEATTVNVETAPCRKAARLPKDACPY